MNKLSLKNQSRHENAWALYQSGLLGDAKKQYASICRKDSKDDRAWLMLGIIQGQLGRLEEAEYSLRRAIGVNPGNFDALANYGLALFNLGLA